MDETDREKWLRLEAEARTTTQITEMFNRLETQLSARFDRMETMLATRATPDQVATKIEHCLQEGGYAKKSELYPIWLEYYNRNKVESKEDLYIAWVERYTRYRNENRSRFQALIELLKNLAWAAGGLIIVSTAISELSRIIHFPLPK